MKFFKKTEGFSLIEVLIGVSLVAIALLGLVQLYILSLMNNLRSDRMTNATFLAQQQIEELRGLTADELNLLIPAPLDELINVNQDSVVDYRRITWIRLTGMSWEIRVLVFPGDQAGVSVEDLLASPAQYKVMSDVNTIVSR